jgi:hypothetical protein
MLREGAIIFGDLIGKLDVLRVAKCGRSGPRTFLALCARSTVSD